MERVTVKSSMLASIGYDAATFTLAVEFSNGSVYEYSDVQPVVHSNLMNSESVGRYFTQHIKKNYSYQQI